MSIHYTRARSNAELQQILNLQRRNLKTSLPASEWENEGFVSVIHTLDLLREMNRICAHILAKEGERVAGYALCMHPRFSKTIDMLQPMFTKIRTLIDPTHKFIIMGQVCIDKTFRKKGILRGLYEAMHSALQSEYDSIITEVDNENQRSLQAHLALGFQTLEVYSSGERTWHLLQLSMNNEQ